MTITLDLTPEQAARLQAEAAREGATTQEYALQRLGLLPPIEARPLTKSEMEAFFEELIEGAENLPAPAPATYDRATAYERD